MDIKEQVGVRASCSGMETGARQRTCMALSDRDLFVFSPGAVKLLLSHGADPNQRDGLGNTPLHLGESRHAHRHTDRHAERKTSINIK